MPSKSRDAQTRSESGDDEQSMKVSNGNSKAKSSGKVGQERKRKSYREDEQQNGDDYDATSRHQKSSTPNSDSDSPPLPQEDIPPLPNEIPPSEDDGWAPVWDNNAQAFYFYNRFTQATQWENPRVPTSAMTAPPGVGNYDRIPPAPGTESSGMVPSSPPPSRRLHGGYNPAIHGDYDPNASYAQEYADPDTSSDPSVPLSSSSYNALTSGAEPYAASGAFNRFTGKWQASTLAPENFNDENKSRRQMNAYFDVDAAANSHDGKSLRAERAGKKLSKQEVKAFREKRREKKEEKRRAWLRD